MNITSTLVLSTVNFSLKIINWGVVYPKQVFTAFRCRRWKQQNYFYINWEGRPQRGSNSVPFDPATDPNDILLDIFWSVSVLTGETISSQGSALFYDGFVEAHINWTILAYFSLTNKLIMVIIVGCSNFSFIGHFSSSWKLSNQI